MFNHLKRRLGIDVLEGQIQFYHKYWMQIEHHFGEMNDHLLEMKEMIKNHAVVSEQKALYVELSHQCDKLSVGGGER